MWNAKAYRGALEGHVLEEVCGAVVLSGLETASGIDPHADSGSGRERNRLCCHAESAGERRHLSQ